jgi:hypothetical protein
MSKLMEKLSEPKLLIPVLVLLAVLVMLVFSNTSLPGGDHGHTH